MTTDHSTDGTFLSATHPPFCEGGIDCEKQSATSPADWEHRGHKTTWHVSDHKRITLELVRPDGHGRNGYHRGDVEVQLTLTDAGARDEDGNEITSSVKLPPRDFERLLGFLEEYREEQRSYTEKPAWSEYDCPAEELPKRHGMTNAQEVWNAISLGVDAGRLGVR